MDIDEDMPRHSRKRVKVSSNQGSKSMSIEANKDKIITAPAEPSKSIVVSLGFDEANANKEAIKENRMKVAKRKRSLSIKQGKFVSDNDENMAIE